MKKLLTATTLVVLLATQAFGFSVFHQIGDNDGFGFGIADNGSIPSPVFDNRSVAEMAASDGSQFTDNDNLYNTGDPTFTHFFNTNLFSNITSATFTIDVQGLQPNAFGQGSLPSYLYLDGNQVPGFELIDLGATGSMVMTFNVNTAWLADGQLNVFLDINDAGDVPIGSADLVAVDFTRLDVEGDAAVVPEPATLLFLGMGLVGIGIYRRRK